MNAKRQVESSLDNSSDYGLDSPTRTVTVADTSGNQMTIYFGNSNDITGDYYVYTDTTDAVYTTESSNYEAFNYGLMDLVSIDSLPSIDSSLIKNITVDKTDGKWLMTYKESGDSDIDYTNQLTWFVTNPSKTESGMDASEASELTSDVSGISTSTCVAYNVKKKALKTYGLDNPQATITIKYQEEVETEASESDSTDESETEAETTTTYENKTFTFYIGDKYSDDYYYFTWDGTNQVCLLSSDTAEYLLGISNDTFLLTTPINITMSSVDKLVANNTTYTIDRTETTDEDGNDVTKTTYTKNGEDFDSSDFSSLFSQIKGITSEKPYTEKEETEEITGDTLTLTYTLNNNTKFKTVTFVFEPYDKDYYSLSVNGSKKWLINKIDVTNLMALF
jgi:hypothetical protein